MEKVQLQQEKKFIMEHFFYIQYLNSFAQYFIKAICEDG
jgi:hypothetical protein